MDARLIRPMTWRALALLAAVGLTVTWAGVARAKSGFETPPVFKARDVAPAELLSGRRFRVEGAVPTDGFLMRFTIKSDFGDFEARGPGMLPIRVAEIGALDELDQQSKTAIFAKAAAHAAARPVLAAGHMVLNPVDTVAGLPSGVGRLFDRASLGAKKLAGAKEEQGAAGAATATGKAAASVLGYESERRRLAKELKVDPYTTNPVLSKKLDEVAWVSFSGKLGMDLAISVAVPFSMALSAASITNDLVWDTPAADLINLVEKKARALGASETDVAAFQRNPAWSLTLQTALTISLERMSGVGGRAEVITLAAEALGEDEARFLVGAVDILNHYRDAVVGSTGSSSITALRTLGRTLAADTRGGGLVIAAPVDYISWTETAAEFAKRPELTSAKEKQLWVGGRLSPRARKSVAALGWTTKGQLLEVLPATDQLTGR